MKFVRHAAVRPTSQHAFIFHGVVLGRKYLVGFLTVKKVIQKESV